MEKMQTVTVFVYDKALAVFGWLVASFNLIFTAFGAIPGMEYVPQHKTAWLVCVAALLVVALWVDTRREAQKHCWLLLMPVLAVAVLRLFIGAEGMGLWQCALALVDLILGGALFSRAKGCGKLKRVAGVLSILVLIPTILLMLFTAVVGTGGIAVRRYPNPSGYYEA